MSSGKEVIGKHNERCESSIEAFKRDLSKVRTGRASPGLVEGIIVDYYGAKTPLQHLGQISTPEPTLLSCSKSTMSMQFPQRKKPYKALDLGSIRLEMGTLCACSCQH